MPKPILLIYPGPHNTPFPELPMSLLHVAWALRKIGLDVVVHDCRLDDFRTIPQKDYLFAGITTLTGDIIAHALEVAGHIRATMPGVPLVWGGIHPTLLPEQTAEHSLVDIVVRGEGEYTVQELARALESGDSLDKVVGLTFMRDGKAVSTGDRPFMDLHDIDMELPYDLFQLDRYSMIHFPMHTSRGCPYRCGFCYNTAVNKRRYRKKSAERTVAEIEYAMQRFGARKFTFTWEDEFFIDVKRLRSICQMIVDKGLDIEWESFSRFNSFAKVDDETLKLIKKSGCTMLSFGGESGSQRMLDEIIQKDITVEQILDATRRLAGTGIRQVTSFMSGLPTETEKDRAMTFALMDEMVRINPDIYLNGIFLYTPYPGTPLYDMIIERYGYQPPGSLEEWSNFGIYRNENAPWHDAAYIRRCKYISILSRFPFYRDRFAFKDVTNVLEGGRFSKFPYNIAYFLLSRAAMFRWKHKFFAMPLEFMLLEKVLLRMRGFV